MRSTPLFLCIFRQKHFSSLSVLYEKCRETEIKIAFLKKYNNHTLMYCYYYVIMPTPYIYKTFIFYLLGLNTKVAQTVAKQLGVPIELVMVKPSDPLVTPNNCVTGGSTSSERCCSVCIFTVDMEEKVNHNKLLLF